MAKFFITWISEKVVEIDAADMSAAEIYARAMINRLGSSTAKLLSIYEDRPIRRKDDKPPTPFNRPPSGTPGAGQMKTLPPPPDQIAA